MNVLLVMLLALQLQPSTLSQANAADGGTVTAIVKSGSSDRGIPDVQVTLKTLPSPGRPSPVAIQKVTDAEGRVSFGSLQVGAYEITAQREGYFPLGPETDSPLLPSAKSLATISDVASNASATMTLLEGGSVSGRLLDAQGKPIIRASVIALHAVYQAGLRAPAPLKSFNGSAFKQTTDDRGIYRLFGLPPGDYFIRADPGNGTTATVGQITYYPGTKDLANAIPVAIRPSEESLNADFVVAFAPVFSVSGTVTVLVPGQQISSDGVSSRALSGLFMALQNERVASNITSAVNATFPASFDLVNFAFKIDRIAPGAYYLFPTFEVSDSRPGGSYPQLYSARIPVEVTDKDIDDLHGVIQKYPDLKVRATLKDSSAGNTETLGAMWVELRPQEAILRSPARKFDASSISEFVLENVFPGKYRLEVFGIPPEFCLADIRQGGLSVFRDPSVFVKSEDTPPIEVILDAGAAQVQGLVVDRKGQQTGASIVLIPAPSLRSNPMLYKRLELLAGSRFQLRGITPGEYKIFAWENIPKGAEENAEFLAKYEGYGRALIVSPGEKINELVLELIPSNLR